MVSTNLFCVSSALIYYLSTAELLRFDAGDGQEEEEEDETRKNFKAPSTFFPSAPWGLSTEVLYVFKMLQWQDSLSNTFAFPTNAASNLLKSTK